MATVRMPKIIDVNGFLGFCPYDLTPLSGWSSEKTGFPSITMTECIICDKEFVHIYNGKTYFANKGEVGVFCLDCGTKTEPAIRIHNVYYKDPRIDFIDVLRQVCTMLPYCPKCEKPQKTGIPLLEPKVDTLARLRRIEMMEEQNS